MIEAIAKEEDIALYKRFTEAEAAGILQVSTQTLRRIRETGEIAYIRVSERNIRYFGLHLCEYILSKVETVICPDTTNSDSSSEITGSPSNPAAQHGAAPGTTQKLSKQDALASARRILNKPSKD
jgi:hypothetical protein